MLHTTLFYMGTMCYEQLPFQIFVIGNPQSGSVLELNFETLRANYVAVGDKCVVSGLA